MTGSRISANAERAEHNSSRMVANADALPSPAAVQNVYGGTAEPAERRITDKLRTDLSQYADAQRKLQEFVKRNADDLRAAVQRLEQSDRLSEAAAAQGLGLIDEIAASATPAAPGSHGTRVAF
jgi:molybdenum-dependent DNA-binding transcriptional regulator ModE